MHLVLFCPLSKGLQVPGGEGGGGPVVRFFLGGVGDARLRILAQGRAQRDAPPRSHAKEAGGGGGGSGSGTGGRGQPGPAPGGNLDRHREPQAVA